MRSAGALFISVVEKIEDDELPGKEEIILHYVLSPAVRAGLLEAFPAYDLPPRTPCKKIQ